MSNYKRLKLMSKLIPFLMMLNAILIGLAFIYVLITNHNIFNISTSTLLITGKIFGSLFFLTCCVCVYIGSLFIYDKNGKMLSILFLLVMTSIVVFFEISLFRFDELASRIGNSFYVFISGVIPMVAIMLITLPIMFITGRIKGGKQARKFAIHYIKNNLEINVKTGGIKEISQIMETVQSINQFNEKFIEYEFPIVGQSNNCNCLLKVKKLGTNSWEVVNLEIISYKGKKIIESSQH